MKKNLLFIIFIASGLKLSAQQCLPGSCSNFVKEYPSLGAPYTPPTSWQVLVNPNTGNAALMNGGNYTRFNVIQGNTYEWTYCENYGGISTSWDAQLTLYNDNNLNSALCFSTDVCGTNSNAPYISWTATFTGVVRLLTSAFVGSVGCLSNSSTYNELAYRQIQNGGCSYTISPTTNSVSSFSGTGSVSVTPQSGCSWSAVSNNTDWLTVTSGNSGTGNGTVNYSYTANPLSSARIGTITIANKTFTITQGGNTSISQVWGVDISHFNYRDNNQIPADIDWSYVSALGDVFAYMKATEGASCYDPKFDPNMKSPIDGITLGAYHFALPEDHIASDEATHFTTVAGSYIGAGYLPPALDIEDPIIDGCAKTFDMLSTHYPDMSVLAKWINDWCVQVYNYNGIHVWPVVYCQKSYAQALYQYYQSIIDPHIKLWISAISDQAGNPNTSGWQNWPWVFHQYFRPAVASNDPKKIDNPGMDQDIFIGDMTAFNNLINGGSSSEMPDLIITNNSQSVSSSTVSAGSNITAYAGEYNQGTATSASNEVGLWLSSSSALNTNTATYLGKITGYPSLSAGINSNVLNATLTIPSNTTPGQYYLFFWADGGSCLSGSSCSTCNGSVIESNECNNFASISPITVTANNSLPDLIISSGTQSVSSTTVAAGSNITAYAGEYNQGTASSSSNEVGLWLSTSSTLNTSNAIYLGKITGYPGLSAGTQSTVLPATVTIPTNTSAGQYYLIFWADGGSCVAGSSCSTCNGSVIESNECNNFASISPITVTSNTSSPDLIISSGTQSVSSTTVGSGSNITAYASEYNQGTAASASNEVGLWLSSSSSLNTNNAVYLGAITGYQGLSPNSNSSVLSTSINIPSNTASGTYYLIFWADGAGCGTSSTCNNCSGSVIESNECNNFASVALNITQGCNTQAAPIANNATTITQTSFQANWNPASGASGYKLDVSASADFSSYVYHNDVGNQTPVTITGLSCNTTYYYRVLAYNSCGNSSGYSSTVPTSTSSCSCPTQTIPVPISATNITSTSFQANWNSATGASGYQVDVSTFSDFSSYVYHNDVGNQTSVTITGLSCNITYYYRVEAYNSCGNLSGYSSTMPTSTSSCSCPSQSAPIVGSATNPSSTSFQANWSGANGATSYHLDVSTNSSFSSYFPGYQDLNVGNVTSYNVLGLSCNTTYFYRVRAYNSCGNPSTNSSVAQINTSTCSCPSQSAPIVSNATNPSSTSFQANWGSASGASGYRIDVSTSSDFSSFVYQDIDAGNQTFENITGLSCNVTYYYRVRAYNNCGQTSGNSSSTNLTTLNCTQCKNQSFTWAVRAGSPTLSDGAGDLAMDGSGNLYMTGHIQGSADFGNGIVLTTPTAVPDIFVSKHNSSGQIQWALDFGSPGQEEGTGIATDNNGDIYVIGYVSTSVTFGTFTITNNGTNNYAAFLLKLNSGGIVQWAQKINASNFGLASDIFIDKNDNIFVTGENVDYSSGSGGLFVAKYNTTGNQQWFKTYGDGFYFNQALGINCDNNGNIVICGQYIQTITLGAITLNAATTIDGDGFVCKLDANGNVLWAKKVRSPGQGTDQINSVAFDEANNVYVVGNVDSSAVIDNDSIPLSKTNKLVIINYDENGNLIWAKASVAGGQGNQLRIILGNDGDLYTTGAYSGSLQIDNFSLESAGGDDGYIIRLDKSGKIKWVKGFGGTLSDNLTGVVTNSNGDVFVAGSFQGTVPFDNIILTSAGSDDIFLAKFNQCNLPVPVITYTGNLEICSGKSVTLSTDYCSGNQYQWQLNNVDISNSNNATYIASQAGSYNVRVSAFEGCESTSNPVSVTVDNAPGQPGSISGNNSVCPGTSQTYIVSPVTGATDYTWTLPSGWTGSSPANSITTTAGSTGGIISVHANNNCGSSSDQTLNVTVTGLAPQPGPISGLNSVCPGTSQTYSVSPVAGTTNYNWTLPSGWTGSSLTNSITTTTGSTGGIISVHANNLCGSSGDQTLNITVTSSISQLGPISGLNSVCPGTSQTYSVSPVAGATDYTWTLPSGWTGSSPTNSITTTTGSTGGIISVHANSTCASSSDQTLNVTVTGSISQPGPISGNNSVCQGTSQTYSVSLVTGATDYTWTLPSGWTGSSTTNSIPATAGGTGGIITVHANNNCGSSSDQTFNVTVTASVSQPGPISGNSSVCQGSSQTYSVSPVTGATDYTWTIPSGWTGSSTGNSIPATAGGTAGIISVHANNLCGSSNDQTFNVTVTGLEPQPGPISGNSSVCQGSSQTYSVSPVTGATDYTWTLPSGWTGSSTGNSIPATAGGTGGIISVHANNNCGSSNDQTFNVTVTGSISQPGPISGNNSVCQGTSQTYSVSLVTAATNYTWTLPSGWTGSSPTNSITSTVGSMGGIISVHANNNCGSSIDQTLNVAVTALVSQPGPISGNNLVCGESTQTYTIDAVLGATGYVWTLPSGWSGSSNTNSISCEVGNTSGIISVAAKNNCGSGTGQNLSVTVISIPPSPTITLNGNLLVSSAAFGNQWYLNGTAIAGATGQGYIPHQSGLYTVQVSVNGCTTDFSNSIHYIFAEGIGTNVIGNYIKVFPNPVKSKLTIINSSDTLSILKIRLFDITGKLLVVMESGASLTELDMTKYSSSIYILSIEDSKNLKQGRELIVKIN